MVPGGSKGQGVQEGLHDHRGGRVLEVLASSATLVGHLRLLSAWPQPAFLNLPAGFLHAEGPRGRFSACGPVSASSFSLASTHTRCTVLTSAGVFSFCSRPSSILPFLRRPGLILHALIHSVLFFVFFFNEHSKRLPNSYGAQPRNSKLACPRRGEQTDSTVGRLCNSGWDLPLWIHFLLYVIRNNSCHVGSLQGVIMQVGKALSPVCGTCSKIP